MKKLIFGTMAFFMLFALIFFGCNTPTGPQGPVGGGGEEVNITDGGLYVMANSTDYPGAEINLETKLGHALDDISLYASVTVDATLYSDETGETVAVPENAGDNLAQFKLLKSTTGSWNDLNNICGGTNGTKYNMAVNGETTWTVPASAQGVPVVLLLQANWEDFPEAVKSIKVKSINFTPKTDGVLLTVVYDKGTYMEVSGNQVTFQDAMYSDCAALFAFPASWEAVAENSLQGKTLTFTYSIPEHTCVPSGTPAEGASVEHQIHIQAAHDDSTKDKFNGKGESPGQIYRTLSVGARGSFTVPANDLIAASQVEGNANDIVGPFILDAVRIVNNGTNHEGAVRCKSYTLVFNDITIK